MPRKRRFEENDPEGVAFEYEVIVPEAGGSLDQSKGTIWAAPILPVDQDHEGANR
jgi:hypothetical protein